MAKLPFEEQTGVPKTRIIKKRENEPSDKHEQVSFVLDREKTALLNKLAAVNHATLNTLMQSIWGILLGKYNGKEDVVFGGVVSGRPFALEGVESMVGLFINTIPVRVSYEEGTKFHKLLQKIQAEALASEPYHYYSLAEIPLGSGVKPAEARKLIFAPGRLSGMPLLKTSLISIGTKNPLTGDVKESNTGRARA